MNNESPDVLDSSAAPPPQTIALVGKYHNPDIAESIRLLASNLHQRGMTVLIEEETARNMATGLDLRNWATGNFPWLGAHADLAIVVGGDGTMLNAARELARYRVPLVGVNRGRLGFLTDVSRDEMLTCLDDLLDGKFIHENRMLLDAEIIRDARVVADNLALNDVVVDKGAIGRMIEFELSIDGEFIYRLRADGLIAATSTGSTAYALSANGPILHPQVAAIALVPLCPHALTNRPILVGDRNEIEIRIVHATDSRAHFDGQVTIDLRNGDSVRIRRSEYSICLLHPPSYSYFSMLRQKLHWSERPKEH
ncbi:MAG: NAD kinase [Candidatus Accumulibacter sp.]|nr:NAD kinase [Accumulibacter sp.]